MAHISSAGMRMMKTIYRYARREDLPVIVKLHRRILGKMGAEFLPKLGEEFLSDIFACLLQAEPNCFLVAHNGSNIVGFLIGVTDTRKMSKFLPKILMKIVINYTDLEMNLTDLLIEGFSNLIHLMKRGRNEARAELLDIVLDEVYQGKGIGSRLALRFLQFLEEQKIDKVQVLVDCRWKQTQLFYEKLGFKYVRRRKGPGGDMWIMVKKISFNNEKRF